MKYLFLLIIIMFSNNSIATDNEFNCNTYDKKHFQQKTSVNESWVNARIILRQQNHTKLSSEKFYQFLNKSTQKNTFNIQLFSCFVIQDLGYDHQIRMLNIQHKIDAQNRKRRMEQYNKLPVNNTSIVYLGSLSTGINAFVFQDLVKQATTDRKLDSDKLGQLIKDYKAKNI
jgi:hypothetical protein